jgi:hypothetical protein
VRLTGRKAHMLFANLAVVYARQHKCLPASRSVALIADIHPATARRWLADLRAVLPQRASAFRTGTSP